MSRPPPTSLAVRSDTLDPGGVLRVELGSRFTNRDKSQQAQLKQKELCQNINVTSVVVIQRDNTTSLS